MSRYIIILGLISFFIFYVIIGLQTPPQSKLPNALVPPSQKSKTISQAIFKETSLHWHIQNKHQQTSKKLTSLAETLGSGVCSLDVNQDGWMDLFFIGGSGHTRYYGKQSWWLKNAGNRLLLNVNGQYFRDITKNSGLTDTLWGMGCSVGDFNNDGLIDLFVTTIGESQLYANQSNNTFTNVTKSSGISEKSWSMAATLGDFNKDGLLDIYMSNFIDYKKGALTFERTQGFRLTTDVAFDATLYDPQPNKLYLNQGNFVFRDVTKQMDVSNPLGRSLGAKWHDINGDSWLDLIVINAQKSANQVFINHQGNKFSRGDAKYTALEVSSSHDLVIDDFNNDQQGEFLISRNMGLAPVFLHKKKSRTDIDNQLFKDEAWNSGLAQAYSLSNNSWAAISADLNNDSFLDLFIANGMSTPDVDAPFVTQGQKNYVYLNNKLGGFMPQKNAFTNHFPNSSRGAIKVDLNNDGILEIVVNNNNGDLQIFENQIESNNNWLGIDLLAENKSIDFYGAKITLKANVITQQQSIMPKQHFLSQSDHRIHFGLGESSIIDNLSIQWPDGETSSFDNIKANQYISINKKTNQVTPIETINKSQLQLLNNSSDIKTNAERLKLISRIFIQYPPEQVSNIMLTIWQNSPLEVQSLLLKLLIENWHESYAVIAKDALASEHVQLRLSAIKLLRNSEIESSINWLIPLLSDSQPLVQCEIAKTFEFYFNEEEAVTHRKYLALSPLIKQLKSANHDVKICIINALARAERKRAVSPLLQLINSNNTPAVQAAAIRALGLIRDKSAMTALVEVIKYKQADVSILASSLIALKRLNYEYLTDLFNLTLVPKIEDGEIKLSAVAKSYQVLSFLFSHADGTVFSKKQLQTVFYRLNNQVDNASTHKNEVTNTLNEQVVIAKLNAIANGKLQQHYILIKPWLLHSNTKIQLHAFNALASLNNLKAKKLFESSLLDLTFPQLIFILEQLEKAELTFSSQFFDQVIIYAHQEMYPISKLSNLLPLLSDSSAYKFFHALVSNKLNKAELLTLMNNCTSANIPHLIKTNIDISHFPDELLLPYGHCIFSEKDASMMTNDKQVSLKKYQLLLTLLNNKTFNDSDKYSLLIKAAKGDALIAEAALLKQIKTLPSQYYPEALSALKSHRLISDLQDHLWKILKNEQQKHSTRLVAANYLVPFTATEVLAYINENFINHE